jgi:hypothetical protein
MGNARNGQEKNGSAVYESRPIKPESARQRRGKAEVQRLRQSLYGLLEGDHPMTVRQVFYRAVSVKLIEKTELAYKGTVCRLLGLMRREGQLPYDWIADNTRWMRKPTTYTSMEEALRRTAAFYRRSLWADQDAYVEIWTEKDALAGVLLEVTREWDVPLMITKGFASLSYLYEAAQQIKRQAKSAYLYYFGDHDPSGVHIDRRISTDLHRLAPDAEIHFKRVAVLPNQIAEWELPTRPTKRRSAIAKTFEGDSVEVDAIPPARLRELCSDSIAQHVDQQQLNRTKIAEKSEKEILTRLQSSIRGGAH